MNLLFEFNQKYFFNEITSDFINADKSNEEIMCESFFFQDLKALTKSTIIDKICYIGEIKTLYDVYNWINYMHKDYEEHLTQYTDYQEDMLDRYNLEKYKSTHNTVVSDLDYK